MQFSETFRAMNTDVDVIVEAATRPVSAFIGVRLLFEQQEERFSRFRPSSLLSRLNAGETVREPFFVEAGHLALQANEFTGGIFNPMVLEALVQAGYGVSFEEIDQRQAANARRPPPVPDLREALVFEDGGVRLGAGQLDLGGIVKGWTVDLGIGLLAREYDDAFINAGGDLRCCGSEAGTSGDGWHAAIDGLVGKPLAWDGVMRGALATSTTRKRRWTTASGAAAHHLIDPRTGAPADSPFEQVSCWAAETWRAEVWAKAVLIGGEAVGRDAAAAGVRVLALLGGGGVEWFG